MVRTMGWRPISLHVCTCVLYRHVHGVRVRVHLCCGQCVDVGVGVCRPGITPRPGPLHDTQAPLSRLLGSQNPEEAQALLDSKLQGLAFGIRAGVSIRGQGRGQQQHQDANS